MGGSENHSSGLLNVLGKEMNVSGEKKSFPISIIRNALVLVHRTNLKLKIEKKLHLQSKCYIIDLECIGRVLDFPPSLLLSVCPDIALAVTTAVAYMEK